jgi:hypothetical protein
MVGSAFPGALLRLGEAWPGAMSGYGAVGALVASGSCKTWKEVWAGEKQQQEWARDMGSMEPGRVDGDAGTEVRAWSPSPGV